MPWFSICSLTPRGAAVRSRHRLPPSPALRTAAGQARDRKQRLSCRRCEATKAHGSYRERPHESFPRRHVIALLAGPAFAQTKPIPRYGDPRESRTGKSGTKRKPRRPTRNARQHSREEGILRSLGHRAQRKRAQDGHPRPWRRMHGEGRAGEACQGRRRGEIACDGHTGRPRSKRRPDCILERPRGPALDRPAGVQDVMLAPVSEHPDRPRRGQSGRAHRRCRLRLRRHHDRARAAVGPAGHVLGRRYFGADAGAGAAGRAGGRCRSNSCWQMPRCIRSSLQVSTCWPRGSA